MELFVALDFTPPVLAALHTAGAALQARIPGPAFPLELPEDMHLTLRYLGDQPSPEQVKERLGRVSHPPFRLSLGRLGCFQNQGETVLWAGVEAPCAPLFALHSAIQAALGGLSLPPEPRPFFPHITLASLAPGLLPDTAVVSSCGAEPIFFWADHFHLCRIRSGSQFPRFETLAAYPLVKNGDAHG